MTNSDWTIKQWTRNKNKIFVIQDADGAAQNISGSTVILAIWDEDGYLLSGECTLASATIGGVYYTIQSGNFHSPGRYSFEFDVITGTALNPTDTYTLEVQRTAKSVN